MTTWNAACQAPLFSTLYQGLLKFLSIESVMPSNQLISAAPFSFSLQSFPASGSFPVSWLESGAQSTGASASASVFLMNIQGWFTFRIDWFDLLAVQRTFKSLLQNHNSKESILQPSAYFMVQLSHSYMTTEKITALTLWTFVGKEMSLLYRCLCSLVFCLFVCFYKLLSSLCFIN